MKHWHEQLKEYLGRQAQSYISREKRGDVFFRATEQASFKRKKAQLHNREAQIIDAEAKEQIIKEDLADNHHEVEYSVRYKFLIQQKTKQYTEEMVQRRKSLFQNGKLVDDYTLEDESHLRSGNGGHDVVQS